MHGVSLAEKAGIGLFSFLVFGNIGVCETPEPA